MRQHLQKLAVAVTLVASSAVTLAVISGTTAASAATRLRSGSVRAQLVDAHVGAGGAGAGHLGLTGPTVMASVVGLMALMAFSFLVVTFIRRRATTLA